MSRSLRPVTKDNWRSLAKLNVRSDQMHFVASNVYSIAEAHYGQHEPDGSHWEMHPFGIYEDDTPVGFLMYGFNYAYPQFQVFIFRLMVAENHQGTGYGRFGMEQMMPLFQADENVKCVGISYEPQNDVARKLYASFGFVETDEIFEGEAMAIYKIR